ncbi:hypothetical protein COCNU_02G015600 [Cocos nucifera]|uniref:Uncharacterized protein n=1 Tax=Cocos nucifera TaxID=13894 RepID=A0A8K0I0Y3_COCNU|nr:hypothetical protein COCNU_02G015600 [Cocos nucifera]
MEFGTERMASSGGSWEPYWHVVGRMESGTERKASFGGSWKPYWRVIGCMEFGTERKASSDGSWEPYWRVVDRMESGTERKASSDLVADDSSSRGVRTCNRVRLKGKLGEFVWLKGRPSIEFDHGTIAEEFDR